MLKNIIIVACLGSFVNIAGDTLWIGTTSDLTLGTNWQGGVVPTTVGSAGEFLDAGLNPSLSGDLTLGSVDFPVANTNSYIFTLNPGSALSFAGAPGVTNSSTPVQFFNIGEIDSPGASLTFPANTASTGPVQYHLTGAAGSPSTLTFQGTSTSTGANVVLNDNSVLQIGPTADVTVESLSGTPLSSVVVGATSSLLIGDSATVEDTYAGAITLPADSTLFIQPNNTFDFSGSLSGGQVTVAGTLNLEKATINPLALLNVDGQLNMNDVSITSVDVSGSGLINLGKLPTTTLTITSCGTFAGSISGAGGLTLTTCKNGDFILTEPNTYSGPTTLFAGELIGTGVSGSLSPNSVVVFNPSNENGTMLTVGAAPQTVAGLVSVNNAFPASILLLDNLQVNQNFNSIFAGPIQGNGVSFVKSGTGLLNLIGNSPNFEGSLQVQAGALAINGIFGTTTNTNLIQGQLQGTGLLNGLNTTVAEGGSIQPGNSIGTLNIAGNVTFQPGSSLITQISGTTNSLLNVSGIAAIAGSNLQILPIGPSISFTTVYPILNAGTLDGTFGSVNIARVNPLLASSLVSYVGNSVFLEFRPTFGLVAVSPNEKAVASVLDRLDSLPPFADSFLGALALLPTPQAIDVLDELSGNQHTADLYATALLTRNFLRRMFDPLRDMVTTLPCNQYAMECYSGIDTWGEISFDRQSLRNDGNGFGFTLSGYDVTFGFQSHMSQDWILGFAGSYVADTLDYNLGGHGDLTGGYAGFYALYRPEYFYALGNLAYGYTQNHLIRKGRAGEVTFDAVSRPELTQWSAYAEAGVDLPIFDILIQPFVGIEGFTSCRNSVAEENAEGLSLLVSKKDRASAFSRLGLHVTTMEWFSDFSFSVDVAWEYQLTTTKNNLTMAFNGFSSEFITEGVRVPRNSVDGALTVEYYADETVRFIGQFGGEVWNNSTSYSVLGGVKLFW